ncbi:MAG: hypothetical protein Q9220_004862 [cf. Caloplaca sp. 1 TL-2023]
MWEYRDCFSAIRFMEYTEGVFPRYDEVSKEFISARTSPPPPPPSSKQYGEPVVTPRKYVVHGCTLAILVRSDVHPGDLPSEGSRSAYVGDVSSYKEIAQVGDVIYNMCGKGLKSSGWAAIAILPSSIAGPTKYSLRTSSSLDRPAKQDFRISQPVVVRQISQQLATSEKSDLISQRHERYNSARRRHQNPWTPQSSIIQYLKRGSGGSQAVSPGGSFDMTSKQFENFAIVVPALTAAHYIGEFLDIIATKIETGYFASTAPSNSHVLKLWSFELSFYSAHAIVPWEFVQAYVLEMQDWVEKGFTGLYNEHMVGFFNGVAAVVSVQFRLKNGHAPLVATR